MPSFTFTGLPTTLPLTEGTRDGQPARLGTLPLSVQNTTPRRLAGRATVRPAGDAKPAWFSFEGAPPTDPGRLELEFAPGATGTLKLNVAVPPDAPAGHHVFTVRVGASDDDTDNDFVESPAVAFDVPPAAPAAAAPKRPFPWWIPVAAAVVLLLGGGGAWWLTRGGGPAPPTIAVPAIVGQPAATGMTTLVRDGFAVSLATTTRNAGGGNDVITAADPQPGSRVAPGTVVRLTVNEEPGTRPPICSRFRCDMVLRDRTSLSEMLRAVTP